MSEEAEVYVVRASGESIRLTVADAKSIYRQLGELFYSLNVPVIPQTTCQPWCGIVPPTDIYGFTSPVTTGGPLQPSLWDQWGQGADEQLGSLQRFPTLDT